MNPSPLPQPSARTCPNCGAAIDGKMALCPHCGAALSAPASSGCLVIGAQILLGLLVLTFGLGGACSVLIGGLSLSGPTFGAGGGISEWGPFIGGGLVAMGLAAACVWGILRLGKKHK